MEFMFDSPSQSVRLETGSTFILRVIVCNIILMASFEKKNKENMHLLY